MRLCLILGVALCFFGGCRSNEKTAEDYHAKGQKLWKKSDIDKARIAFEQGLELDEDNFEMRRNLARIYYEIGEKPYLKERRWLQQAKFLENRGENAEQAAKLRVEADQFHKEAAVGFGAANKHLDFLIKAGSGNDAFKAHVLFLRHRTALFFENGTLAIRCFEDALKLAKVTGLQKAKYEEYLKQLKNELPKPLRRKDQTTLETLRQER